MPDLNESQSVRGTQPVGGIAGDGDSQPSG